MLLLGRISLGIVFLKKKKTVIFLLGQMFFYKGHKSCDMTVDFFTGNS